MRRIIPVFLIIFLASAGIVTAPAESKYGIEDGSVDAGTAYTVGQTVSVIWTVKTSGPMAICGENTYTSLNVEYYDETESASRLLVSYSDPTTSSDSSYTASLDDAGDDNSVYVYYATSGSVKHDESGTCDVEYDTYAVYAAPEFPFGLATVFGMSAFIYFSMRRKFLKNI